MPHAQALLLPDLGHLAHEEAPDMVMRVIGDAIARAGTMEGTGTMEGLAP
jgi:pimeloyl-ACP methyl ester carboxylesterase